MVVITTVGLVSISSSQAVRTKTTLRGDFYCTYTKHVFFRYRAEYLTIYYLVRLFFKGHFRILNFRSARCSPMHVLSYGEVCIVNLALFLTQLYITEGLTKFTRHSSSVRSRVKVLNVRNRFHNFFLRHFNYEFLILC